MSLDSTAPPSPTAPAGRNDLACPLCEYSLRGLVDPRCPECGYAFEWAELLDAERQRHPYLFEHHPRHNVRSFFKTLSGGLRPGRFWRTLHPSHPANLRRLTLYWVLATTLTVVAVVADFARHAYDELSIDDIAQAAGISKGLLYHYFSSKREFYAATVRSAAELLLLRTDPGEGADPEALLVALDAYLSFAEEHASAYVALMRSGVGHDAEVRHRRGHAGALRRPPGGPARARRPRPARAPGAARLARLRRGLEQRAERFRGRACLRRLSASISPIR